MKTTIFRCIAALVFSTSAVALTLTLPGTVGIASASQPEACGSESGISLCWWFDESGFYIDGQYTNASGAVETDWQLGPVYADGINIRYGVDQEFDYSFDNSLLTVGDTYCLVITSFSGKLNLVAGCMKYTE